jgi:hypothetical protein
MVGIAVGHRHLVDGSTLLVFGPCNYNKTGPNMKLRALGPEMRIASAVCEFCNPKKPQVLFVYSITRIVH